jgi:DMSO reductase anchor subunit
VDDAEASVFLPAAPDPQITLPTTTYKTRRPFPRNLLPADYFRVNPQHAHWPLVVMLVLTQLSVGAFTVGLILESLLNAELLATLRPLHATSALGFGLLAIGASLFHLGRPQFAFRAVLGLRHSWLSREIVAFGAFAALAFVYAVAVYVIPTATGDDTASNFVAICTRWLGWCVAFAGAAAVFCSTMIYVFTRRECWSFVRVGIRFLFTCAILGCAAIWLSILVSALCAPSPVLFTLVHRCGPALCRIIVMLVSAKLAIEAAVFRHIWLRKMTPLKRSAILMTGELSNATLARFALGVLGGAILPLMLMGEAKTLVPGTGLVQFVILSGLLFSASLAGELLERYLFFAACAAPQMPGGIR